MALVIEHHYLDLAEGEETAHAQRFTLDRLTPEEQAAIALLWQKFNVDDAACNTVSLLIRSDEHECPDCHGMNLGRGAGYDGEGTCGTCAGSGVVTTPEPPTYVPNVAGRCPTCNTTFGPLCYPPTTDRAPRCCGQPVPAFYAGSPTPPSYVDQPVWCSACIDGRHDMHSTAAIACECPEHP